MTTSVKDRLQYHPDPRVSATGKAGASGRRVDNRRVAIEGSVPVAGQSVIDFGCSGGYFGFAWSTKLSSYLGVDGDAAVIARNQAAADELRLPHLRFVHGNLTPSFVRGLPAADIGIFLSVFHHVLASSSAYDWNRTNDFDPFELLVAMREKVGTLVFETGYPDEGMDWCSRLPPMLPTPRRWVEQTLLNAGFSCVTCLSARSIHGDAGHVRSLLGRKLGVVEHAQRLSSRIAQRFLRYDPRDDRDVFVAR